MVQIELESPDRTAREHEPVSCGIPWPQGTLREVAQLSLIDTEGQTVRLQARALEHWPDGSVRWALLDWQAVVETKTSYRVEIVPGPPREVESTKIQFKQEGPLFTIDTGAARFVLRSGGRFPFDSVTVAGQSAIDPERTRLTVENDHEQIFRPRLEELELIESGPLRLVTRVRGSLGVAGRKAWCLLSAYLHFFAGLGVVRIRSDPAQPPARCPSR